MSHPINKRLPKAARDLFVEWGRQGGRTKSERKRLAARANAKKPRPNRRKPEA